MHNTKPPEDFKGRFGRYVLLRDRDGLRHAVRGGSILLVCDIDGGEDLTMVVVQGGRILIVASPLEEVLVWLD